MRNSPETPSLYPSVKLAEEHTDPNKSDSYREATEAARDQAPPYINTRNSPSHHPTSSQPTTSARAMGKEADTGQVEFGERQTMARSRCFWPIRIAKDCLAYKTGIIILLAPIIASPLLATTTHQKEAKCAFCVVVMAVYWMMEVLPLAVTALLPLVLFPMLGVLTAKDTASAFMPDTNFLFVGSLIVAVAVEKCNLHSRVALRVLTLVGADPKWIMLGFMSVTAFLSMWISNTATTAMMVPIAQSVISQLFKASLRGRPKGGGDEELRLINGNSSNSKGRGNEKDEKEEEEEESEEINFDRLTGSEQKVAKGLLICIAFAANIGGTGTITGTPPNLVTVGILADRYGGANSVSYATWIYFAVPLMLVSVALCWVCLVLYFLGFRTIIDSCRRRGPARDQSAAEAIKKRWRDLPSVSFAEVLVLILFMFLLILWIFRDPKSIPGIGSLFVRNETFKNATGSEYYKDVSYYTDGTSAMMIAILLFILPNQLPDFLCFKPRDSTREPRKREALMDWKSMQEKFPWSVVLLLGGGFALAKGVNKSGLSVFVGNLLNGLKGMSNAGIQFICVVITIVITNICSNTVTASIFVPIVAALAESVKIHPFDFCLPVTLACSFAFTLPVATPPNAIVFASGMLKVSDMMKAGMLISVFSVVLIVLNQQTYARVIFNLDEFPEWAAALNSTTL